jgi:uncharacterized membrane protein YfcA
VISIEPGIRAVLMLLAFLSGIGITAIGPGGIFITIALFLLTAETPATIAGTASAMFIATGILGTVVYASPVSCPRPLSGGWRRFSV